MFIQLYNINLIKNKLCTFQNVFYTLIIFSKVIYLNLNVLKLDDHQI